MANILQKKNACGMSLDSNSYFSTPVQPTAFGYDICTYLCVI